MDPLYFHFKHPTTIEVSEPTRFENTRLVQRILKDQLIKYFASRIILVYSELKQKYDMIHKRYSGIKFEKRWRDDIFDSLSQEQRIILVIDDQMDVTSSSKSVSDLFTKRSHHIN